MKHFPLPANLHDSGERPPVRSFLRATPADVDAVEHRLCLRLNNTSTIAANERRSLPNTKTKQP